MSFLLFPGRHHLLTNFQFDYLKEVVSERVGALKDRMGEPIRPTLPIDTVIWCVTSANHSNTRRNPIPSNRREAAIERFSTDLPVHSYVFHIDDIGTTPRFAEYVIKKVEVDSRGRFHLTPANTVVGCSTPEVIVMYEQLGYQVLPIELEDFDSAQMSAKTPWQIMNELVEEGLNGQSWKALDSFQQLTSEATRNIYERYRFEDLILALNRSPILTDDGDLTETRDYNTYVRSFDHGADRKFERVKPFLKPGRIVDIGCCTGALLQRISCDDRYRESDLFGIEVARPLYAECLHRKQQGHFENDHVFFYQQNFADRAIFPDNSIDTFLTFSLTHEIESYGGREALLKFLSLIFQQTSNGGRWINVDVVGPDNGDQLVWAKLSTDDGVSDSDDRDRLIQLKQVDPRELKRQSLDRLSTFERFQQFANDFRASYDYQVDYELVASHPGVVEVRLSDLCEFLSKKDYTDNWESEMHETFCFWSFEQWKQAVEDVGFVVREESHAYQNPWIIENRYQPCVQILRPQSKEPMAFPVTNLIVVAEKP